MVAEQQLLELAHVLPDSQAGEPRHLAQAAGQRRTHAVLKAQVLQALQRRDACWHAAHVRRCVRLTEVHAGQAGAPATQCGLIVRSRNGQHDTGAVGDAAVRSGMSSEAAPLTSADRTGMLAARSGRAARSALLHH
jgi:hypothetical protein